MAKYQNKYRISSTRLQNWDYGWNAPYFVTICTKDRECYFGDIVQGKMQLSNLGILADVLWYEIKHHAPDVELDVFVIMPNHIHGILVLNGNGNDTDNGVETRHALSLPPPPPPQTIGQKRFQNQGKNTLSSIVGAYKSVVTRHARRLGYDFTWQSRFYDHIIRNEDSYRKIQNYIQNNPMNWKADTLYVERINV